MEAKRRQKETQSVPIFYSEPRFKDVRMVMEAASLHDGREDGVNMWNFLLQDILEIIFSKDHIKKSSSFKLNTVFGVVIVIFVKNNHRQSIVYENEAVLSVICLKHGKQAAFRNNYCILGNAPCKSRGICS